MLTYISAMQRNKKDKIILKKKKWLQISEEIMHRKLISNTKTLELENLGKILYETKCKRQSKIKTVLMGEEEEIL